jgi:hypothetical protein
VIGLAVASFSRGAGRLVTAVRDFCLGWAARVVFSGGAALVRLALQPVPGLLQGPVWARAASAVALLEGGLGAAGSW